MNFKKLISLCALASLAAISLTVSAKNINVATAKNAASEFIKSHARAHSGSLRVPSMTDLHLTHAEASSVVSGANAYYAFNMNGGGFIIVAGEDRANTVLGYSDNGHLDFNNLPDNFKALMRSYKEEIEYLQAHPELNITPAIQATGDAGVAPLIKTTWGQEMPYYLQCPVYNGEYCVVGCVATAMAQVMYYWKFPTSCDGLNSYYCYDIGQTIPSLPSTTFEYNQMLPSYCHWDWDLSELIQDTYTDAQAQAVAKLSRYCGQAVDMGYSPEGSGAYVFSQLAAMKDFGFRSSAHSESRTSWWNENYTTAEWEAMLKEELDKHWPILYSATDPAAGGHAFICDGYNSEGLFHFNFGWYGTCDGWYASTALNMTHRDGDALKFNSDHEILLDVAPPTYRIITADAINASNKLLILGEDMEVEASNVNILTSNSNNSLNLIFRLFNSSGRTVATSQAVSVTPADFEPGSTVTSTITLPANLESGSYKMRFLHYTSSLPREATPANCEEGTLNVVGHVAKFNGRFTIDDVSAVIDYLLNDGYPSLTIDDVSMLVDTLLAY